MADPRRLAGLQLAVLDATSLSVDDLAAFDEHEPLVLEDMRLTSADMQLLSGIPLALDGCVVAGADLSNASLHGIKNSLVQDTKLRGTRFWAFVRNVVIERCQLTECVMRMATLEGVVFENSQLAACDFYGSELTGLSFPGSTFQGVGFDQCTITDVDLTQAADLQIGDPRTLTGAALCETQVPLIAARLAELSGIEIRDC